MSNLFSGFMAIIYAIIAAISGIFGGGGGTGGGGSDAITVQQYKGLAYGSDSKQIVDLYVPSNAATRTDNGVIIVLHGGAWLVGDQSSLAGNWKDLANKGYIVALVDYRTPEYNTAKLTSYLTSNPTGLINPSVLFGFYQDLAKQGLSAFTIEQDIDDAITYLNSWFKQNNLNVTKCALAGESAGAHEAMLYAYSGKYQPAIDVKFVVDRSGPTNMDPAEWTPLYEDNFATLANLASRFGYNVPGGVATLAGQYFTVGLDCLLAGSTAPAAYAYPALASLTGYTAAQGKAAIDSISPVSYVKSSSIPTIICYGEKDITVPPQNGVDLNAAFANAGAKHATFVYANSDHFLANDKGVESQYQTELNNWISNYFGY